MRFGWVSVALVAVLATAACKKTEAPTGDGAEQAAAARFFLESNGRAEGVTTLPSG
ncbi:MAG: FKBP-type peptidyl-prolyl cis-trans isomerase, partial [Brevundimonas sp.]